MSGRKGRPRSSDSALRGGEEPKRNRVYVHFIARIPSGYEAGWRNGEISHSLLW